MTEKITIEPRRVNYESDFDFMLWFVREGADGEPERFFPDYDFTGVLSSGRRFVFSRKGGRYVNCRREGDGLRVVCDNHGMAPGGVWLKLVAELPDGIYPDGFRREVSNAPSGIELVRGSGDGPTEMEVALTVPFVFRSAYDMAVDAGFEGTEDDFRRATAMMPAAVDVLRQVSALTSDWAEGRERIASALRAQGVDASATDSFDALAEKVRGLRLAPEADPVAVSPRQYGGRQTLLEFMHNNRRAGFPGMVGVELYGLSDNLHGADAYLCSDGYDSSEGGEHEFDEEHSTHYVIHYYAKEDYQVPTYDKCAGMIVLGGRPALPAFGSSNMAYLHTYDCRPVMTGMLFQSAAIKEAVLHGLEENRSPLFQQCSSLWRLDIPDLENVLANVIYRNTALESIFLPGLVELNGGLCDLLISRIRKIAAPHLKTIMSGTVANNGAALTEIELPALETILGGMVAASCAALARIELPALETLGAVVVNNCEALTEIELPALETISKGPVFTNCNGIERIVLPALRTVTNGAVVSESPKLLSLSLPSLETTLNSAVACDCPALATLELPMFEFLSSNAIVRGRMTGLSEIYLPRLAQTTNNGVLIGSDCRFKDNTCHVYLPTLGRATHMTDSPGFCRVVDSPTIDLNIYVHLGSQSYDSTIRLLAANETAGSKIKAVTVEQGFRTNLRIDLLTALPKDNLAEIISNLGDNNGNATLTLTLGAANIAKLDEDTIALAQAKNYTIV